MGTVLAPQRPVVVLQQHHLAPAFTLPCVILPEWGTNWRAGLSALSALSVPARQGYGKAVEVGAERIQEAHSILRGMRRKRAREDTNETNQSSTWPYIVCALSIFGNGKEIEKENLRGHEENENCDLSCYAARGYTEASILKPPPEHMTEKGDEPRTCPLG